MRYRNTLIPTLREDPSDAEVASHKLLVRAGMIRQVARGIYDFLPLGLRAVRKVEGIVREEMNRAGAQEILLPAVCPAELWQESGRWDRYGKELLRFRDRYDREFCFGPTHEEVVTDLVRREVRSYRDLPLNLYQIQVKFRDEMRPRFGLMRGREFLMKDAYSFHATVEDCEREYELMAETYRKIFRRCGLAAWQVESDTGAIGGLRAHEFHVLAESGEDTIVHCPSCGYSANVELAETRPPTTESAPPGGPKEKVATPGRRTVEEVSAFLGLPADRFVKTLLYRTEGEEVVAVLVRGDHEVSETKLKNHLGVAWVALADDATVERITGAPVGFAGPSGLRVRLLADRALRGARGMVSGANEADAHWVGLDQERDFPGAEFGDFRRAEAGDPCPRCPEGRLEAHRGIEVGNIFFLGTKYSEPMRATFLDAEGRSRPVVMGTYGIGITRTVAAAVEQHHDEKGIVWPPTIAPAHLHLLPTHWSSPPLRETSERLYRELGGAGVEVLLDDREERPGVKFADADLLGLPLRLVLGPKSLERGVAEWKERAEAQPVEVPLGEVVPRVVEWLRGSLERSKHG
ncbi:MAG: proline--tRNA ligase [Candidatus Binatia bacterium]|nr:MAG: proline--tRNA ligase [Candidatus Binatia bacterium]